MKNNIIRILGVLPLMTGLVGMLWLIRENVVNGVGISNIGMAFLLSLGLTFFAYMFLVGLGMIAIKDEVKK